MRLLGTDARPPFMHMDEARQRLFSLSIGPSVPNDDRAVSAAAPPTPRTGLPRVSLAYTLRALQGAARPITFPTLWLGYYFAAALLRQTSGARPGRCVRDGFGLGFPSGLVSGKGRGLDTVHASRKVDVDAFVSGFLVPCPPQTLSYAPIAAEHAVPDRQ